MLPFLTRLSSTEVLHGLPWEIEVSIPDKVREDKKARDQWINRPSTTHCCYSLWDGVNSNLRVSTRKDSENPPATCFGIVLDFDYPATPEQRAKTLEAIPLPVFAIEHTLTPGHWRAIILFEKPVTFSSVEMVKHFLKHISHKWKVAGGLDKGALEEANRYYTSSGSFEVLGDKVSSKDSSKLFGTAFEDYKFKEFSVGLDLKIEDIKAELEKQYPAFVERWDGPFDWEASGPTFWVPESQSPKSAIVKKNGMFSFADHAPKTFVSWTELLGADFVNSRREDAFGEITARVCRTGREFMIKMHDDVWRVHNKDDLVNYFRCTLGLSSKVGDDGQSQVEKALAYVREFRRVDAVAPALFDAREIIDIKGKKVLNELAGRNFVHPPSEEPGVWGPDGNFPWLSHFHDTLLEDNERALPHLIAWLSRFYRSGYFNEPRSGHAVGMSGGVGVGKTLWSTFIVPLAMGPVGDPIDFLKGDDAFGGHLFSCAVWSIDDGSVGLDLNTRKRYSERLKSAIANRGQRHHVKFMTPIDGLRWCGRIIITCNLDAHSVRSSFPNLDISISDKIMLFRATEEIRANFMENDGHLDIIRKEMPFFCRYLLDYQPPAFVKLRGAEANRFGIRPYKEEMLLQKVDMASPLNSIASTLDELRAELFQGGDNRAPQTHQDYTSSALYEALCQRFPSQFRGYPYMIFVQSMESLAERADAPIKAIVDGKSYVWRLLP